MNKNQTLNKKQQAEKKKMLIQLKKEIENLEHYIEYSNITNFKIKTIKNLKITARALQLVSPYILTAGIVAGGFVRLGTTPFYSGDEWKRYANIMIETDSNGNIRTEKKYGIFDTYKNKISIYSKWNKNKDTYTRTITTYYIQNKTQTEINELLNNKNIKIENILGNPYEIIEESKTNLTKEELETKSYIKVVTYKTDRTDYIMVKESKEANISSTILYILVVLAVEIIPLKFRSEISKFDFSKSINEINKKHPLVDKKELSKKLELKRNNYNRLTR